MRAKFLAGRVYASENLLTHFHRSTFFEINNTEASVIEASLDFSGEFSVGLAIYRCQYLQALQNQVTVDEIRQCIHSLSAVDYLDFPLIGISEKHIRNRQPNQDRLDEVAAGLISPHKVTLILQGNIELISLELVDEILGNIFASAETNFLFSVVNLRDNRGGSVLYFAHLVFTPIQIV